MTHNEIIEDFALAWKNLDAELIIKHLADEFQYDSQWVFSSLDCEGYKEYLRAKFQNIKKANAGPKVKIVPDTYLGDNMLQLKQGDNDPAYYRIKVKDGKVVKGDLCML